MNPQLLCDLQMERENLQRLEYDAVCNRFNGVSAHKLDTHIELAHEVIADLEKQTSIDV